MSRELKIALSIVAGVFAARVLVLLTDAIAESIERSALDRG